MGSIPGSGGSLGEGNSSPFQYSCLENSMDRGALWSPWSHKRVGHGLVTKQVFNWAKKIGTILGISRQRQGHEEKPAEDKRGRKNFGTGDGRELPREAKYLQSFFYLFVYSILWSFYLLFIHDVKILFLNADILVCEEILKQEWFSRKHIHNNFRASNGPSWLRLALTDIVSIDWEPKACPRGKKNTGNTELAASWPA